MSQWKLVLLFSEILLEAASHVQIADVSANIKMSGNRGQEHLAYRYSYFFDENNKKFYLREIVILNYYCKLKKQSSGTPQAIFEFPLKINRGIC